MKIRRSLMCVGVGLVPALGAVAPLDAQCRLFVQQADDTYRPVVRVEGNQPCIWRNDQTVPVPEARLILGKADTYLAAFIALHDIEARASSARVIDIGATTHSEFRFSATWESPFLLNDVFLALCLDGLDGNRRIFVHEVGRIEPWTPRRISVAVPGDRLFGSGAYQIHLFAGGLEVFNSEQPEGLRDEALDQMLAHHLARTKDGNLKPLYAPAPEYPPALRQTGIKGRAVVKVSVSARGEPVDPAVTDATDPAFGDAALAAIRTWRFLPRVKDGYPVTTVVKVPFNFAPPAAPVPN